MRMQLILLIPWKKYADSPATDSQVSNAVKLAQRKIAEIRAYLDGKQ